MSPFSTLYGFLYAIVVRVPETRYGRKGSGREHKTRQLWPVTPVFTTRTYKEVTRDREEGMMVTELNRRPESTPNDVLGGWNRKTRVRTGEVEVEMVNVKSLERFIDRQG